MRSRSNLRFVAGGALGGVSIALGACVLDFDRFQSVSQTTPEEASTIEDSAADVAVGDDATVVDGTTDAQKDAIELDAPDAPDVPDAPTACDAPNLVARWKFDDGSGTHVSDCTSNHLDGTIVGTPVWTTGHAGGALELDLSWINLGGPAKLQLAGAMTATAWINVKQFPAVVTSYVVGKTDDIKKGGWRIGVEPDAISFMVARSSSDKDGLGFFAPFTEGNVWVHVAGVFVPGAGGGVSVYINAAFQGSNAIDVPSGLPTSVSEARIGVRGDTSSLTLFRGVVDDVRVYDKALNATEIAQVAAE